MKQHPLSADFPAMPAHEIEALADDIKKHGQREPGVLFEGMVLDGWHRYLACEKVGVEFRAVEFDGDDPDAFVQSLNLHRRHLSQQQRRERVQAMLKADPQASDRAIAKAVKVDHKTVAAVRREAVDGGEIPHHAQRVGADGVAQPAEKKTRQKTAAPKKAPAVDVAKLQAENEHLRSELAEVKEALAEVGHDAQEVQGKLEAFENTEPDEQQKEIIRLQRELRKMEADRDYWKRRYYDEHHTAVEATKQAKRQQKVLAKLGRAEEVRP